MVGLRSAISLPTPLRYSCSYYGSRLLIVVSGDLFRRHDVSGFAKVLWVIAFVLFSYIGVFAYLLTQGRGMAERKRRRPARPGRNCDTSSGSAPLTKSSSSTS